MEKSIFVYRARGRDLYVMAAVAIARLVHC